MTSPGLRRSAAPSIAASTSKTLHESGLLLYCSKAILPLSPERTHHTRKAQNHEFRILSLIFCFILFIVLLPSLHADPVTGTYATIDNDHVPFGGVVIIRIAPHTTPINIMITDGTNKFRYNGATTNTIGFHPQEIAHHTMYISQGSELVEQLEFDVVSPENLSLEPIDTYFNTTNETKSAPAETVLPTKTHILSSDKTAYTLGDTVTVTLNTDHPEEVRLNIVYDSQVFRFLGDTPKVATYEPKQAGAYRVVAAGPEGAVIDSLVFTVAPAHTATNGSTPNQSDAPRIWLHDARGLQQEGIVALMPHGKPDGILASIADAQSLTLDGPTDFDFIPASSVIKHVSVHNFVGSSVNLGIDEFTGAPLELPIGHDPKRTTWSSLYAVDPTALNASNLTVTVTATGTELFTCKDWDFANRACLGAWVKVRDTVPGENYTLQLDPSDPGFGETIAIPSGGWTATVSGTTFNIKLCGNRSCSNLTTVFNQGDTVYVTVNATAAYIRTTAKNQFDIYEGGSTGSLLSVNYFNCTPTSADGPYSFCEGNFTIPSTWDNGWYFIDSEQVRTQSGGIYTAWRTPFLIGDDQQTGESLKFFVNSSYATETDIFPPGSQVFVEFNLSGLGTANSTTTVPMLRDFKQLTGGGTALTESFSNTTGPYRFNATIAAGTTAGWYVLEPNLMNSSSGGIPSGASVHGRMILIQANTVPNISNISSNSPVSSKKSVGESIIFSMNISDSDEVDNWIVFVCNNNSFNTATRSCNGITYCSNTTYITSLSRNCTITATSSINASTTAYGFVCDPRNCSSSGPFTAWGVYNDSTAPSVTLVTPINDPTGNSPRNFTNTFNFIPSDDYGIVNCTLYTNETGSWTAAVTNTSITNGTNNFITKTFTADGYYKWNVQCTDYAGNSKQAAANFTLLVAGPPIVRLLTPANASYQSTAATIFTYNVTYGQNISNCSLYINNTLNQTDANITSGAQESFNLSVDGDGVYTWNVQCIGSDGRASFGDNVLLAGISRYLFVDSISPTLTLQGPADTAVINASSVDFIYQANDTFGVANCSLYVDGVSVNTKTSITNNVNNTISFLLNNGLHPWYVTCMDRAGNSVTSATRTVTANASNPGTATFYETDYTTGTYSAPANINLSTAIDNTSETIAASIPLTTTKIFADAESSAFQGNGIIIPASSTVNFSGSFSAARAGTGYITWKLYKSNSSTDALICQSGSDDITGTSITATGQTTYKNTCTSPASATRITGSEWVTLRVSVYNDDRRARTFTHYIDSNNSYTIFNFTRLGVLTTNVLVPAINLTIAQNETFNLTCAYNCSGGSCLGVNVYAERNVSGGWQQVPASGTVLILNGSETNPHSLGTVAFPGGTTTFVLNGSALGSSLVRCNATSTYSNATITDQVKVTVSNTGFPTMQLNVPANRSYTALTNVLFNYTVTSNRNVANCSLYINGIFNQTNTTITKDTYNYFNITGLPETTYNWSVTCIDTVSSRGNSTNNTFTVDRGPPTISLNAPTNYSNFTTDRIVFNWTASDSVGAILPCNVTIDGAVQATNINSTSGVPANATVSSLTIGVHNWNVTCIDAAGNRNTSSTWMFNITNLPTNVTLLAPANATWNSSNPILFFFNVTDPISVDPANCSLYINNTLNVTNSTRIRLNQSNNLSATLGEGTFSWKVTCVDSDGTSNTSQTQIIFIDRTPPRINLTSPANATTTAVFNIPFSFNASDNLASSLTCNISLDSSVNVTNTAATSNVIKTSTINNIVDGLHNWSVTCVDLAGNSNTSAMYNFSVIAPPNVTLNSPANNAFTNSSNLTLIYNVSENNVLKNCTLIFDGALNQTNWTTLINNNLNNFTLNNTPEGLHNWSVNCTDAGPYTGNSTTRNITVDTVIPTVLINAPANNTVIRTSVAIVNWTATDNLDTSLTCSVIRKGPDGTDASKANIASPNGTPTTATYSGLPDGQHNWNVTCIDDAGNRNVSLNYQFNISILPSITLVSPTAGHVNGTGSLNFTYVPYQSYGLANCTLVLDNVSNVTNTSIANNANNNLYVNGVAQGNHTWSVNCTDNTGGEQNSTTRTFIVDLTQPNILQNAPAQASVQSVNNVTFNYTPTDTQSPTLTCNLSINAVTYNANTAVNNGTATVAYVLLPGGGSVYTWNVTCTDWANNTNTSLLRSFSVVAPPTVTLISPANNSPVATATNFTYNVSDPYGIANCSLFFDGSFNRSNQTPITNNAVNNFSLSGIAPGNHNWSVRCYDVDGDLGNSSTYFFSSDVTPPFITLNAPANTTLFSTSNVTFNYTPYDDYSSSITCQLYVDSVNRSTNTTANNTPILVRVNTLPDGVRYWNATCTDSVGNSNTSETRIFTVNESPRVSQSNPATSLITNRSTTMMNFTVGDNDGFTNCSILINGTQHTANQTVITNNALNNINVTLATGTYNWSVLCYDNGTYQLTNTTANRNITVNLNPPTIALNAPADNFASAVSYVLFNWTANDTFGGAVSCNLSINNTVVSAAVSTPYNTFTTKNITNLNDSSHNWTVTCIDPAGNVNSSVTQLFSIAEPPTVTLSAPVNNLRTNTTTINFTFTPTDNSGGFNACTLMINGAVNKTITTPANGTLTNFTISGMTNSTYTWSVNCTDMFGNMGTSVNRTLNIDTFPPNIILNAPANESAGGTNVTFNWTANDAGTTVTCNLTIDDVVNVSNIAGTSGTPFLRNVTNIPEGQHNWSATCWDDLNQANTSLTYIFYVNAPDLVLNDTVRIAFNNTNPNENDTINITANVSNIGGVAATNAKISFWDGDPYAGGSSIGNATITVLPNQSAVASILWNITRGYHTIYAVADYDLLITEMDDANNNASKNISVLRLQINAPVNASMTNLQTPTLNFTVENFTGGNFTYKIFADGTANGQSGIAQDNVSVNVTLSSLSEGIHRIIVQANDSNRFKNSTAWTFIIDLTGPATSFTTANNTFYKQQPFNVTANLTDNYDALINFTVFVDGAANGTGSSANNSLVNMSLNGLSEGVHQIIVETLDDATNRRNSTPLVVYVDFTAPSITLNSPSNNTNFNVRSVTLNYTPVDNLDTLLQCSVVLDAATLVTQHTVNGSSNTTSASGLVEGTHLWNVSCWDGLNSVNQVNNLNTSFTYAFGVFIPPSITLISPANNIVSNSSTQVFQYNVSDESGITNCSLYLNGVLTMTNTTNQVTLNAVNNFTVTGLNNTYNWSVSCTDNSSGLAMNSTANRSITIDLVPPLPAFNTANATWFNTSTPGINATITDNFDTLLNWSIYVDGTFNVNGTLANGTPGILNLSAVADGLHTLILQSSDDAGNYQNSTVLTIYVDTVKPLVTLIAPANDTNLTDTSTTLNFTATDNLASVLACNVTLDNVVVRQYNLTNGTYGTHNLTNLASGYHYWNATCADNATNRNTSLTWRFYVQVPDFVITSGNITFNNSVPIENDSILINATIFNLGQLNISGNITAQIWLGNPATGTLLSNQTIQGLNVSQNVTISTTYTARIGLNQIYVQVDPPLATNGTYPEGNESNNIANHDFWVGLYEVFAGGSVNDLKISDASIIAAFNWNQTNTTGSNVFVADSESSISFTNLYAFGLNSTNGTAVGTSDFEELDTKLNTTSLNDSINATWTVNGAPKGYQNITAYKRNIIQIPIVNSTNSTSFATGILWDKSDGGNFYNGSQDVVFVTVMNQSQIGQYGTYDYEIKVPAKLRDYIAGGGTVTFYTELR